MSQPIIEVKSLTKEFVSDEVVTAVLHGLDFSIEAGGFVAIMGPSGSGKSTLMHILGFLDRPTSGVFKFAGQDVSGLDEDARAAIRRDKVGFVFQSFHLLPRTTVLDNVALPLLYNPKVKEKDRASVARQALEAVGLSHRVDYLSGQLSGGEKQRVAIARALVNQPEVIFADEPTGNLDSKSGTQVMAILEKLNQAGKTIILVTHERYTAEHAKRIIRLKDGLIVEDVQVADRKSAQDGELQK